MSFLATVKELKKEGRVMTSLSFAVDPLAVVDLLSEALLHQ